MKDLERVLGQRRMELAEQLKDRPALGGDRAERFVEEAAHDLLESYRWQAEDLDQENLSAPRNIRSLLRAMCGYGIASRLGLPQQDVWDGLRTFVPLALRMAERTDGPMRGEGRGPGRFGDPSVTLLGLADEEVGGAPSGSSWRSGWRGPSRIAWPPPHGMLFPGRRNRPSEPPAA